VGECYRSHAAKSRSLVPRCVRTAGCTRPSSDVEEFGAKPLVRARGKIIVRRNGGEVPHRGDLLDRFRCTNDEWPLIVPSLCSSPLHRTAAGISCQDSQDGPMAEVGQSRRLRLLRDWSALPPLPHVSGTDGIQARRLAYPVQEAQPFSRSSRQHLLVFLG